MNQLTAVITGASAGIGAAIAKKLSECGYRLVLIARRLDKLQQLAKSLPCQDIHLIQLDISDSLAVQEQWKQIEQSVQSVDLLVNNAGVAFGLEPAAQAHLEEWDTMINTNIKGMIYCTHAVLPYMLRKNQGHIINLGSIAGTYPYPGAAVYCGTKAFVRQFSLCLRADLHGTLIRVTCIEPGLLGDTEFSLTRFRGDEQKAHKVYENTQPLTPEDIANTVYFCHSQLNHVNINTIEMMPVYQSFGSLPVYRTHTNS